MNPFDNLQMSASGIGAAGETQATARNHEFEDEVFIPLWNGYSLNESVPIELVDLRLRERHNKKITVKVISYDGKVGHYDLYTGRHTAHITLITQNAAGVSVSFERPINCLLNNPSGKAYKEFVSAIIWWARHDYKLQQTTIGVASPRKERIRRDAMNRYALLEVIRRKKNLTESKVIRDYWGHSRLFSKYGNDAAAQQMVSSFASMDDREFWRAVNREKQKADERKKAKKERRKLS